MTVFVRGVGETPPSRTGSPSDAALLAAASLAACRDAGLAPTAIDGLILAGYRGQIDDLVVAAGLTGLGWTSRAELGGASSALGVEQAGALIQHGLARTVLVATVRRGFSGVRVGAGGRPLLADTLRIWPGAHGRANLEQPVGLLAPVQHMALLASRWIHDFAITDTGFGMVAVAARQHASTSPTAYLRQRPLTLDEHAASPMISTPLRKLDCCIETDAAGAILLGGDPPGVRQGRTAIAVLGASHSQLEPADSAFDRADLHAMGVRLAGERALAEAGRTHADIKLLGLYDAFTFLVVRQLEELGFCGRGEGPRFLAEVGIGPDGGLPVNTHGGLLAHGHLAGMNHIIEMVRELRATPTGRSRTRTGLVTGIGEMLESAVLVLGAPS